MRGRNIEFLMILANRLNDLDGTNGTCVGSIGGLTPNSRRPRRQGVVISGPAKGDVRVSSGPTGGRSRWVAGWFGGDFDTYFVVSSEPGVFRVRDGGRDYS